MATALKSSTVYLDPVLHRALKLKALETSRSLSEIINEALKESPAEDADDLAVFDDRADEPSISYEQMVKRLRVDGRLYNLLQSFSLERFQISTG